MGPDAERNEAPARNVFFLEPYYGGSHRAIADAVVEQSRHRVTLLTMPARHWKWRLRGSAYHLAAELRRCAGGGDVDLVLCSTPIDVSLLRARCRTLCAPILLYVHEHQFSYPTSTGETPDANYPLTDLASALAADAVWFNSHWCRNAFLEGARSLLGCMPDYRCRDLVEEVAAASRVVYPGVNPPADPARERNLEVGGPVLLWNHRWEHDKSPELFFEALEALDRPELPWRLAVVGGAGRHVPPAFEAARTRLAHRIDQWGFVEDRAGYRAIVERCDIVVSTARQENFGLAVLEAVRAGLLPVLPRRLSYPELYDGTDSFFYDETEQLAPTLEAVLYERALYGEARRAARRRWASAFDWPERVADWDRGIEEVVAAGARRR